jgi:hypothetical protein
VNIQRAQLAKVLVLGKIAGAVGNYNAHIRCSEHSVNIQSTFSQHPVNIQ